MGIYQPNSRICSQPEGITLTLAQLLLHPARARARTQPADIYTTIIYEDMNFGFSSSILLLFLLP